MRTFIAILKFAIFIFMVILYILTTAPCLIFINRFPHGTRKVLSRIVAFYCSIVGIVFNLKVKVNGLEHIKGVKKKLFVSNHMSYLDIIALVRRIPCLFITSMEIKETLFLGNLTDLAGCLYVERRNKENLSQEIISITNAVKDGLNVVIYPEATSTNGEEIKRFRSPLFQAAIDAEADIIPVSLNYTSISGEKTTRTNRDFVCWYDEMDFLPHFWSFLRQTEVVAEFTIHPSISSQAKDSKLLAAESQVAVTSAYHEIN